MLELELLSPPPVFLYQSPLLLHGSQQMGRTYLLCKCCVKGSQALHFTVGRAQFAHEHTLSDTYTVTGGNAKICRTVCVPLHQTMLTACTLLWLDESL